MKKLTKDEFVQKVLNLKIGEEHSFLTLKRDMPDEEEYLTVKPVEICGIKVILANWSECDSEVMLFQNMEETSIIDGLNKLYDEIGTEMPYLYFVIYE